MSERVQKRMEAMADEIERMKIRRLLPEDQIQFIVKNRRNYENKINSMRKQLQDYKNYIKFERMVLKKLKTAKKGKSKSSHIEYKIIRRVKSLYELAMARFPKDFSMHLDFFKFCKKYQVDHANKAIQLMMKHFPDSPEMWLVISGWYAYDCKDIPQALSVLNKAFHQHKDCEVLYLQVIKLLLLEIKSNDSKKQKLEEVAVQHLSIYVGSMFEHIKNFSYYVKVLNMLEPHGFTKAVQDKIVGKLIDDNGMEEKVWDVLARRELNGFHFNLPDSEEPLNTTEYRFGRCVKTYEQGLGLVSAEKRSALWTLYLDCLVEILQTTEELSTISTTVKNAFCRAQEEMILNEKYFVIWMEMAQQKNIPAEDILKKATDALPTSVHLWKHRLLSAMQNSAIEEVNKVFQSAIENLKENSFALWLIFIEHHVNVSKFPEIQSIYQSAMQQPPDISNKIKPLYIEWLADAKDISAARDEYHNLASKTPYCKELHQVMVELESRSDPDSSYLEKVYKLACDQFKQDIDVYLSYIRFVISNFKDEVMDKVQLIYRNAQNSLAPASFAHFHEEYFDMLANI